MCGLGRGRAAGPGRVGCSACAGRVGRWSRRLGSAWALPAGPACNSARHPTRPLDGGPPQARLKFQDWLSLKALPGPALKIQHRFPFGRGGSAVRVSYECPLHALGRPWQPPAKLLVCLDSAAPTGVRLTQAGLEFDQAVRVPGSAAVVRAAGRLGLPDRLPLDPGQPLLDIHVQRVGLKCSW